MSSSGGINVTRKLTEQSSVSLERPSPSSQFAKVLRSLPTLRPFASESVQSSITVTSAPNATAVIATAVSFCKKRDSSYTQISSSLSSSPLSSPTRKNRSNKNKNKSNSKNGCCYRRDSKHAFFSQFFWGDLAVALAVGALVGASIVAGFFTGILIVTDPFQ